MSQNTAKAPSGEAPSQEQHGVAPSTEIKDVEAKCVTSLNYMVGTTWLIVFKELLIYLPKFPGTHYSAAWDSF